MKFLLTLIAILLMTAPATYADDTERLSDEEWARRVQAMCETRAL